MIPEAEVHPSASREIEQAAAFYDRRSPGLGERFLLSVEKAIEEILFFPAGSPRVGRTVRQKTLLRFPYSVFYLFDQDRVMIVALAHQKREPAYWIDRLPR